MSIQSLKEEIEFLNKKISKLNDDIIESQKTKTTFISLVANQLNNPMTVILGLLPNLEILESQKNRQIFEFIYEEVLNLDFKIQNLLSVTKIESAEVEHSTSLVNIQDTIDDVLNTLKYSAKSKNIEITVKNDINKKLSINAKKLFIILRNLISNAILHGFENSQIIVASHLNGSVLYISVQNQGELPKLEYKEEIFTRFNNVIDQEHGLGIGLSVVRGLLLTQDGSIDYSSQNSTIIFSVTIPIKSNEFTFESKDSFIEF